MLATLMSRYWWVLLLRGVLAIIFGIVALTYPGMTLASLVLCFAAFAFVDGISNVFHAFSGRKENESWWVLLFEGLLGITFGVITFQAPGITAMLLLLYIGFWAIAIGVLRIILAVRPAKRNRGRVVGSLGPGRSRLHPLRRVHGCASRRRSGRRSHAHRYWSIVTGIFLALASFKVKAAGGKLQAAKERLAAR